MLGKKKNKYADYDIIKEKHKNGKVTLGFLAKRKAKSMLKSTKNKIAFAIAIAATVLAIYSATEKNHLPVQTVRTDKAKIFSLMPIGTPDAVKEAAWQEITKGANKENLQKIINANTQAEAAIEDMVFKISSNITYEEFIELAKNAIAKAKALRALGENQGFEEIRADVITLIKLFNEPQTKNLTPNQIYEILEKN